MQTPSRIACMLALWTLAAARPVLAGQPLETETARLIPAHRFEVESGFEMQSSSFGHETAVPLAFVAVEEWAVQPAIVKSAVSASRSGNLRVGRMATSLVERMGLVSQGGCQRRSNAPSHRHVV